MRGKLLDAKRPLELEVDERLEVGGDELADHEDGEDAGEDHQRQRHAREPDAVAALETLRQPMYQHSGGEHQQNPDMLLHHLRNERQVPLPSYALHHILRRVPRLLIGLSRIQIRAAAEEKTRESDENEGHKHRPGSLEPGERRLEMTEMIQHPHERSGENNKRPDEEHIEHRSPVISLQTTENQTDKSDNESPEIHVAALPEAVDQHTQTVQAAPDHKVPAGPVPQTSEQHRVHTVDVRDQLLAVPLAESDEKRQNERDHAHHAEHPPVLGERRSEERDAQDDGIRPESAVAVASERDVEVVLQPLGERNMPAFPELARVARLVRRVEILRQIEAHQHSDARGDISVAGEVRIDLQGVAEQRRKILKTSVKQRILEDAVAEIHSEVVAEYQLLGETVQNPEHRDAELPASQEERLVQLRHKLLRAHDRSCDQLREKAQVEAEIQEVANRRNRASRDVDHVADRLEREERDAYRQENRVHAEGRRADQCVSYRREQVADNEFRPEQVVHDVRYEVRVLIVTKQRQVDYNAQYYNQFPSRLAFYGGQDPAHRIVEDYDETEEYQEESAGLVIEEKADEEKEGVAEQNLVAENAEESQDYREESPEIELRKQQRMSLIKGEQVLYEIYGYFFQSHHLPGFIKCSTYLSISAL